MSDNVVAVFGGPKHKPEVNEGAIQAIEALLEKARSGEVIGVVLVALHHDRLTSYLTGGFVGSYSMIGGLEVAKSELIEVCRND